MDAADTNANTSGMAVVGKDNVPVYLSQREDGTPLYIRQFPPTVEELLKTCSEGSSFEGFSEASGSTFDGFSDGGSSTVDPSGNSSFSGFLAKRSRSRSSSSSGGSVVSCGGEFVGFSLNDSVTACDLLQKEIQTLSSDAASRCKREKSTLREKKFTVASSPKCRRSTLSGDDKTPDKPQRVTRSRHEVESGTSLNKNTVDPENLIGDHCSAVGCTVEFLDSMKIKNVPVNYGMVYELNEFAKRIDWSREYIPKWIQRLSGIKNKNTTEEDMDRVNTILRRRKALTVTLAGHKYGAIKLQNFDLTRFILPSSLKPDPEGSKLKNKKASSAVVSEEENDDRSAHASVGRPERIEESTCDSIMASKTEASVKERRLDTNSTGNTKVLKVENKAKKASRQGRKYVQEDTGEGVELVEVDDVNSGEISLPKSEVVRRKLGDAALDKDLSEVDVSSDTIKKESSDSTDLGSCEEEIENSNGGSGNENLKVCGNGTVVQQMKTSKFYSKEHSMEYENIVSESTEMKKIDAVESLKMNDQGKLQKENINVKKRVGNVEGDSVVESGSTADNDGEEMTSPKEGMVQGTLDQRENISPGKKRGRKPKNPIKNFVREIPATNIIINSAEDSVSRKFMNIIEVEKTKDVAKADLDDRSVQEAGDGVMKCKSGRAKKNEEHVLKSGKPVKGEPKTKIKPGKYNKVSDTVNGLGSVGEKVKTKCAINQGKADKVSAGSCNQGMLTEKGKSGSAEILPKQAVNDSGETKPASDAGIQKTPVGTLGVSKSGRIRKASAKGIQSIEVKCLFMEDNFPVSAEARVGCGSDGSYFKSTPQCKSSTPKSGRPMDPEKLSATLTKKYERRSISTPGNKNASFTSYSFVDNHLVPNFTETDYNLGPYCTKEGVTIDHLNTSCHLDIHMTNGLVKELYSFYTSRKAPKTALAIRLFKMTNVPIVDYSHLLSCVIRITKVSAIPAHNEKLDREFRMPVREGLLGTRVPREREPKPLAKRVQKPKEAHRPAPEKTQKSETPVKPDEVKLGDSKIATAASADGKSIRAKRPRKVVSYARLADEGFDDEAILDEEILHTKGKEGSITRGDIYFLYTKWLRNKMSVSGNVFVTDLLKDVEKLMEERKVQTIRVPAGTLMSSSVRLHEEYKEMLLFSKEDALMYLEEDWLEDIQYLVSKSKSRRSTVDGDNTGRLDGDSGGSAAGKADRDNSSTHARSLGTLSDYEHSDEPYDPDWSDSMANKSHRTKRLSNFTSDSSMFSVGKRMKSRKVNEASDVKDKQTNQQVFEDDFTKQKAMNTPVAYEVEMILNHKEVHYKDKTMRLCYLVRWLGFGPEEDCWVNEEDLECPKLLHKYWNSRQKPSAPNSHKRIGTHNSSPAKACKKIKSCSQKPPEASKDTKTQSPSSKQVDHDKENMDNVIHEMSRYTSIENSASEEKEGKSLVSRREVLEVYDNWRQENQNVLMAGGSNSMDLEVLVERMKYLMESRNVKTFHSESLLNACFLMTLMKTRMKSKKALDTFLDSNCSEVFEASHMQHIKRHHSTDKTTEIKKVKKKDSTGMIYKLKSDFETLKEDFASVKHHREIDHYKLGALEEELECLQNAFTTSEDKISAKDIVLQNEVHKLKADLAALEKKHFGVTPVHMSKQEEETEEPESNLRIENVTGGSKAVQALINLGVPSEKVESIQELISRRLTGQTS